MELPKLIYGTAWKKDKTKDIGFIAEEVEKVFPNLVSYEENEEINGIQYSKLTTVLVKALQQQQEQIDELKKEIFILKQQGRWKGVPDSTRVVLFSPTLECRSGNVYTIMTDGQAKIPSRAFPIH